MTHAAVAAQAGEVGQHAPEAVADWRTAPVGEPLRQALGFLEKLVRTPEEVTPADVAALREAGLSDEAIEHVIYLCACYNVIDRLADTFDFAVPNEEDMHKSTRFLLRLGYRV